MYFAPEMSVLLDRNRARSRSHLPVGIDSPIIEALCKIAREAAIWVHAGSMPYLPSPEANKAVNRTLVIDDQGRIAAQYDKMHLFDVNLESGESWMESAAYTAGKGPQMVQTPVGLMGLSICYDLRFPELFSAYARAGADIFAVPSAFTRETGAAHWHTLLRARAIECASYVIAAAQCGTHEDGRSTFGHSLVVDPWGEVILDMGDQPGLGYATINPDLIAAVRAQVPVRDNRRDIPAIASRDT